MANHDFQPTVTHTRCARNADAVTPSDSADLNNYAFFGLLAGASGTIKVDMVGNGAAVTYQITQGILLPIQVRRVYATGTTATGIVALY